MSSTQIGDHALLSDCHSAVLVDRGGSVEWWCPPSFDSPSVFGRILDDAAGHFSIRPVADAAVARRYEAGSLVLVTTFRTSAGTLELTDALAMGEGVRHHELGADSPSTLLRWARCTDGTVELDIEFVPRLEYGLTIPVIRAEGSDFLVRGGPVALRLSTTASLAMGRAGLHGRITLHAGDVVGFAVQYTSSWEASPETWSQQRIADRLTDTLEAWRSWEGDHQRYEGAYRDLVHHSGRVLQALTYQPTGAIIAAPTTSLPEAVGGERNWDYRFAWMRDASLTLDALWIAACPDEAASFVRYLTTVASTFRESGRLQIMFGIRGERDLTERTLHRLEGWRGSRPVRIGNDAWSQVQLDVYGELLGAFHRLGDRIGPLDELAQTFLTGLADAAAASWQEADHGIWEMRGQPDHYVHSKLMCWVALDRAIALAPTIGAGDQVEHWTQVRAEIRSAILEQGWSDAANAFTQTFGGTQLDASNLLIPIVGFLPANDPRVVATIEATERELTDGKGLVYRYRAEDGLAGEEGAFLLCTFWLAEALARAGQPERAREVFDRAASYRNDVDLLSEEVEVSTGELIGNFPQAFSHVGLVNAAWAITEAEQGHDRQPLPGGLPHLV